MADLDSSYEFRLASSSDLNNIEAFLYDHFAKDEPLNRAFGLTIVDCGTFFPQIVREAVLFPISYLAISKSDGSIAGCQLSTLFERGDEEQDFAIFSDSKVSPNATRLIEYLSTVDKGLSDILPDGYDRFLKMTIVSVSSDHQRKGLCSHLKKLTIAKAKEIGCDGILAESTSIASQAAMKKLGFEPLKQVDLSEFNVKTDDGTTHTIVNLMKLK